MDFEEAARKVARLLEESVGAAVSGEEMVAVAFSGGLDSSVVARCASKCTEVVACTAFTAGAGDRARALKSAAALGLKVVATELTRENVGEALSDISLPFTPTLMDRSLWCLYSVVARSARAAGAKVMLLGQLADELFGGYAKYETALGQGGEGLAAEMMRKDALEYAARGRVRDIGACGRWVEPRFPFESKELQDVAMRLPVQYKITGGVRKAVLRRAAAVLGVSEEQAGAPKKAAQYSSGVQKLLANSFLTSPGHRVP